MERQLADEVGEEESYNMLDVLEMVAKGAQRNVVPISDQSSPVDTLLLHGQ